MATATMLLPQAAHFAGQVLPETLARALGRADRSDGGEPGTRAQLLRHFQLLPRGWPVAALSRQADCGDAAHAAWLRADPAWVRPDINGARLFGHGAGLQLTRDDVEALLPALRPLFGDSGFTIDAPTPARWYLRLPREARLPVFTEPDTALGTDLLEHLVDGDRDGNGTGSQDRRRWRALLSEAQVVLHNHPWNAQRVADGKPPVNSLWFWGGGILPDQVTSRHSLVQSEDALLRGLAMIAAVALRYPDQQFELLPSHETVLLDLREIRDPARIIDRWLMPAASALAQGALTQVKLDFGDGTGSVLTRGQRWRFWRRPLTRLVPAGSQDSLE